MHQLSLKDIEAVAAGSAENWWFKSPSEQDMQRIKALVSTLRDTQLQEIMPFLNDPSFKMVNNRFYVLLCAAEKECRARGLEN